jgi:hypothetical protein
LFRGSLTTPDMQIQGAEVSITLQGYGNAIFSAGPMLTLSCMGKSIKDVLLTCMDIIGYKVVVKDNQGETVNTKLNNKIPDQIKTDTPFNLLAWALKLENLGFVESLDKPNEIIIYDLEVSRYKPEKAKYTFVQWRQISLEDNIFPLVNFSVDSSRSLFLPGRSFGNRTQGLNESKKESINSENDSVNNEQYKQIQNASKLIAQTPFEPGKTTGWISLVPNEKNVEQTIASKNETVNSSSVYQKFSLETYGLADIAPLDQVNLIVGDIEAFTGVLSINSVTHVLNGEGWKTTMEATKIQDASASEELSQALGIKMTKTEPAPNLNVKTPKLL